MREEKINAATLIALFALITMVMLAFIWLMNF